MRTQDEIVARIETRKEQDAFGFETDVYIVCLDFVHARPYLKDEVSEKDWAEVTDPLSPIERMRVYMDFAWGKANSKRGLSASRSILHCIAWSWLAEEDELLAEIEHMYDTDYHHYGKPILEVVCDHFGWDWAQWDDGVRTDG